MTKLAGQVKVNVINEAQTISVPGQGLAYVLGPTKKGPVGDPRSIINSVAAFRRHFGNDGGLFTAMCTSMLMQGVNLRVSRVIGDNAEQSQCDPFELDGVPMFYFKSKYPGLHYNDLKITLSPGQGDEQFTLDITDGYIKERFENLSVPQTGELNYLKIVEENSRLVTPVYYDGSGSGSGQGAQGEVPTLWVTQLKEFSGGTDGDEIVAADYQDAMDGFDPYYDGILICAPHLEGDTDVDNMLAVYASARKDIFALVHVPNSLGDKDAIVAYAEANFSTNNYLIVGGGGLVTTDLGYLSQVPETARYAALLINQYNVAPWLSPSGARRGLVQGTQGPVNNFGSPAYFQDLEEIIGKGVNMVIRRNNMDMFWSGYTMAQGNSPEKFISVSMLLQYMVRVLKPTLEAFISEPNEPTTWSQIYYRVENFLNTLVSNRALLDWKWDGDQFASSMNDLQINDPQDVSNGIYKIQLQIQTVSPIVVIELDIIMTQAGVEFK